MYTNSTWTIVSPHNNDDYSIINPSLDFDPPPMIDVENPDIETSKLKKRNREILDNDISSSRKRMRLNATNIQEIGSANIQEIGSAQNVNYCFECMMYFGIALIIIFVIILYFIVIFENSIDDIEKQINISNTTTDLYDSDNLLFLCNYWIREGTHPEKCEQYFTL